MEYKKVTSQPLAHSKKAIKRQNTTFRLPKLNSHSLCTISICWFPPLLQSTWNPNHCTTPPHLSQNPPVGPSYPSSRESGGRGDLSPSISWTQARFLLPVSHVNERSLWREWSRVTPPRNQRAPTGLYGIKCQDLRFFLWEGGNFQTQSQKKQFLLFSKEIRNKWKWISFLVGKRK